MEFDLSSDEGLDLSSDEIVDLILARPENASYLAGLWGPACLEFAALIKTESPCLGDFMSIVASVRAAMVYCQVRIRRIESPQFREHLINDLHAPLQRVDDDIANARRQFEYRVRLLQFLAANFPKIALNYAALIRQVYFELFHPGITIVTQKDSLRLRIIEIENKYHRQVPSSEGGE